MGTADNPSIPPISKGIIPRAMSTLFSTINSIYQSKTDNRKFSIKVSFIEIHNEDLIDLLGEGEEEERPPVLIREDAKGNIYWSGLQEVKVSSVDEVINYLAKGSQHRQVGATDMNEKSSRSHAIFSVTMIQQKFIPFNSNNNVPPMSPMTPTYSRPGTPSSRSIGSRAPSRANSVMSSRFDDGEWVTVTSKFHFVDLAGSERLKRTAASGERAKEGIAINSGLLALGNVISALGDPNKAKHTTHIPYRDSKLTRLLQDSLGGNAKTLLIACVSPAEYNINETTNTLKYANRARNIKNSAVVNQEEMGWNDVGHLQYLVIKLRQENNALKTANAVLGLQQQQQSATGVVSSGRATPTTGNLPPPSRKNSVGVATGIQGRNTPTSGLPGRSTPTSGIPGRSTPTSGIPGRSTPTSGIPGRNTPTNGRETPNNLIRRTSSPLTTLAHGNVQNSKEIEMLEEQLVQLQRSYAELSQKYAKTSAELAMHQNNYDDETNLHGQSSNFLNSAKIEEYEETITSLESKLAMMNAALSHSESLLSEQETKHKEVEESDEHNKNVINSLQNYIKEIETKLEKREIEIKLQTTHLEHPEKFISETVRLLEQRLQERDAAYQELEARFNELKKERVDNDNVAVTQETKVLLDKLDDRDRRINQLEFKLNLLVDELDKLRKLEATNSNNSITIGDDKPSSPSGEQNLFAIVTLESKLAELQKSHEDTVTELIDVKTKYQSSLGEIQELQSSLREAKLSSSPQISEDDRLEITALESKFAELEKTYEKTVTELAETKFKYEESLNVIRELQSQLDEASFEHSEMIEELHSISSTPITPMTPRTPMTPYTDNHHSKEPSNNAIAASSKSLLHRKVKSLSADLLNSEKHDNAHAAIVEKLQFELKLFESFHKDKSQSLDAVKHELSRLELNHRETLQIVEELREEIRRRDALAKLEVKSIINSKQIADQSYSSTTYQVDELEIVQRLREEVEQLKVKQGLAMESIAEREIENKRKAEVVEKLESNICELKEQLHQAEEKQRDINTTANEQLVNELQSRVKELEEKLVKALEFQNKHQTSEVGLNFQQISDKENEGVLKLREQVSKLQTDIESKNHTIAALLLPDNDHQSKIRRLEGELCEVKKALRVAIEEKNSKFSIVSESSSDNNITSFQSDVMISEESSSDKPKQSIDENVIALEGTVKELETQLSKAKECQATSPRTILHDMDPTQKTVDNLEVKLATLQKVLTKNSDNVQKLNGEQELVATLQSQLFTLKLDIKRKNELIESLKRDLVDKGTLQQVLREKEAEVAFLKKQLDQIKRQDIDMQKQMKELQDQLEKVEKNNSVNKVLQSELEAIKKEFKDVKGKEAFTLERLRILDAEESKLQKDLERLRNVEISQREQIAVLEAQVMEHGGQVDKDLIKLRTELALAKESEISEKRTIATLESKLNKSESEVSILQSEIDELKLKENEQLKMIQDRENKLNEVQISSPHEESLLIKRLNEEIEQLRSEKSEQHIKIQILETRMKLVQEDPTNFPLRNELVELKTSEFHLQQKVHELEQQLASAQEKYQQLQFMRNELKVLQESESGQKTIIFQLQTLLQETKEAKETVIREWENMKDNFCAQTKLVATLEGGLQTMMEELNMAKENHAASLKELEGMTNFLTNTLEQRDEDEKKIEALEAEIHSLKEGGMVGNNDYKLLRKELSSTKKEMEAQNKLLIELEKQMEALEKERDQYVERTNQLNRTIVTQEIKQREAIAALESTISDLQSQLEEAKSTAQIYQDTMTTLGEKLTKVELQLDESKASDEKHAQMVNEFKSVLKEANAALIEKEKMITGKTARLAELELMVKKTKAALEEADLTKSLESERVKELQAKVAELESRFRNSSSSAELKDAQRLADQQLEYIKELEITCDNVKNLTAELEELKAAEAAEANLIEELEKALHEKEENLQELTNILNETRSQLDKVKNSEVYNVDHVQSLESQLQEARERRDEEIIKLKQANVEIEALRKRYAQLQNEAKVNSERIEELEHKAMQFVTERNETLVSNGVLESQIHKLRKDFDSLTDEFEEVATKYADAEIRVDEQKEQIAQLEAVLEIKELEAEKRGLEQANEMYNKECNDRKVDPSDGDAEIQDLNKKIAELEEENDGKTQLIEMLEETLKENEEELSEAKQQLIILRREKSELERKIENLKYQLDTIKNEYDEMKTSVKEKEEIENILAEERKLKKNVEMAYAKLENQVEQLLSKKSKFTCF